MASDPLFDLAAAMDGSPIPQQDHGPPKMPEQMVQEGSDIQPREIAGAKSEIEGQPSPLGRHGQRTDCRDPILLVDRANDRGAAFRGPGAGHVGNEQEARFIEEDQMGATSFGVFLYAASGTVSTARSPRRPVVGPGVRVSDSSSPTWSAVSRHGRDGRPRPTAVGSAGRCALRSRDRSDSRRPGGLSGAR